MPGGGRNIAQVVDPTQGGFLIAMGNTINVVAGGAKDGVWEDHNIFDRMAAIEKGGLAQALLYLPAGEYSLAEGETLDAEVELMHGDDPALADEEVFVSFTELLNQFVGDSGGTVDEQISTFAMLAADLTGAKRYIRMRSKLTFSAANTDEATYIPVGALSLENQMTLAALLS